MTEYEIQKNKIKKDWDSFVLTDDLILLAELYLSIQQLLHNQGFPIRKYKEWKKKQNPR